MKRTRPHLHVVRLQNDAPLSRPISLQGEYEILKRSRRLGGFSSRHAAGSRATAAKEGASIPRGEVSTEVAAKAVLALYGCANRSRLHYTGAMKATLSGSEPRKS